MTLQQAIAHLPLWLRIWIDVLLFGVFVLPFSLFIWRESRIAAVAILVADVAAGFSVSRLYGHMGYVKLLGLPHIIFWVPLAIYLFRRVRRADVPIWPRRIISVVLVMIMISLAFDCIDVVRYLLGERTPLFMPA